VLSITAATKIDINN